MDCPTKADGPKHAFAGDLPGRTPRLFVDILGRVSARRYLLLAAAGCLAAGCLAAGCSTAAPTSTQSAGSAGSTRQIDVLDEPVDPAEHRVGKASTNATADPAMLVLPDPPADMAKTIDADNDDWSNAGARRFADASTVVSGQQFWTGAADTSFEVRVDADGGHVYFWVDVADDTVIDAESQDITPDGVVIWLRDPKLQEVVDSLPDGVAGLSDVEPQLAILFTPDGQFWRYDKDAGQLYRTGIDARTKRTDTGYRLEVGLSLGVLGQVADLPTEDVAFRVDVIDGDEPDRRGRQTRLSMLADPDGPRFGLYNVGGWLPYRAVQGRPPRPGALGRWRLHDGTWRFDSFEARPNNWLVMEDVSGFDAALGDSETLQKLCPAARDDRKLLEAYESRGGTHRAGLVICGPRAPGGRCPADAKSHLYWVHLRPDDDGWQLADYAEVSPEPLAQCVDQPRPDAALHTDFSLLPLEMLPGTTWGIGWTKDYADRYAHEQTKGIWFADPHSQTPYMGMAVTQRVDAQPRERVVSTSRVYLALVDDARGLDVCEIEHVKKQSCRGLDRSCRTRRHGELIQAHIKMWVPRKARFQKYLLTKHKRCNAHFDFSQRKGFLLIHEAGRLGAIASPAN